VQSLATVSKLRLARLTAGRSLLELDRETGISSTKLSAAERGLVTLTRAERRVLARALGATAEALFGDEEMPS